MKQLTAIAIFVAVFFFAASAMAGDYGRYSSCRAYGLGTPRYSYNPALRNYSRGGELYLQNGYLKGNGTYVAPHLKTRPDNSQWNNLGNWR